MSDFNDSNSTIIEEHDFNSEIAKFNYEQENVSKKLVNVNIEISDDSEDDLIKTPFISQLCKDNDEETYKKATGIKDLEVVDNLFEELAKKYNLNFGQTTATSSLPKTTQLLSDSDESNQSIDLVNMKEKFKYTKRNHKEAMSDEDINFDNENTENEPVISTKNLETKLKKRKSSPNSKETKLLKKAELQKEREQKKQAAEREKELKKAFISANKSNNPEKCIEFITAIIDTEIMSSAYGTEIGNNLVVLGAEFKIVTQIMPNTVTWVRKIQTHLLDNDGKLTLSTTTNEEQQMLIILSWKEVVELVHQNGLLTYVNSIKSVFENKRISLGIYGFENYFRYCKNEKKKDVRSEVNGLQKKTKNSKEYCDAPKVSRRALEFALTELQLLSSCCYRFLESANDVGLMIAQFTKSIAQAPYKLEKNEQQQQAEWYMSGDNKDCVRVDKDGNGLQRLWQQQLTSFPLARIETAEAIIAKYPTLTSLIEAYNLCKNNQEREQLLQDLPIRRAAGPLTAIRKIGPEFSRKVNIFFTSNDGQSNL